MKTDDIISLENMINAFSFDSIARKLQETATTIRHEQNPSTVEILKHELHLLTLTKTFKTWESSESASTATTILEKMAYWFSEQTALENYRALTLHCFNLYFERNIPGDIEPLHIIMLGKAFIADPIKYAGYLFWLLENNLNPRDIDDSRLTQQFFAYHAFDLEVIKNTYQLFENVSKKTTSFLHYFNEISSQIRGYINVKIENNAFRSYNVLGIQYDHPQIQFFYAPTFQPLLSIEEIHCYELDDLVHLYELFDWAFIELLDVKLFYHRTIIQYILKHSLAEIFLITFAERALSGEVSLENALNLIDIIKTFWNTKGIVKDAQKIKLLSNHPFLIHSLTENINLSNQLGPSLNAFQQRHYQTLSHLPFLCSLYKNIPEILFYSEDYQATLIKLIFNIIAEHGNTLSNAMLSHLEPIASALEPVFREFLMMHQKTLIHAIDQFASDQIDFLAVENAWGNQLSLVNLTIYICPKLKEQIKLPYDKYDLYVATVDKIATLPAAVTVTNFRQFLSLFEEQVGLPRVILQETLKRTTQPCTRELILQHISPNDAFIAFTTQPMLNEKSLAFYAVKAFNFDLLTFMLNIAEHSTFVGTLFQNIVVDCFNEIITSCVDFLSRVNSHHWRLMTVLLPYLKNHERFIVLIKSLLTEAIHESYNAFIVFLLSKEHISFLTPQFIAQTLLQKEKPFMRTDHDTVLLLCGMRTEMLPASELIQINNLTLYFSYVRQSIEQLSHLQRNHIPFTYDDYNTGKKTNLFLLVCDEKENNILHLAAQHGHFTTLKMIFEALERQTEDYVIFHMLEEKNTEGNIPCAQGDHPTARQINAYLKRQYDRYKQLHDLLFQKPSSPLPRNDHAFFSGNRKRSREETHDTSSDNSLANTVRVDDDTTDDSDFDSFQADSLAILSDESSFSQNRSPF